MPRNATDNFTYNGDGTLATFTRSASWSVRAFLASIVARLPTAGQTARIKQVANGTIAMSGIATTATATVTGATAANSERAISASAPT